MAPRIGITCDLVHDKLSLSRHYADMVWRAGGLPVVLPVLPEHAAAAILDTLDGLILSGGDDPIMETFGCDTHPKARPMHPDRQRFELALLDAAQTNRPDMPVLGICLGMQLMALHSGGALEQHLPDTLPTHADHWNRGSHTITGSFGTGVVHSHHRQAVKHPGKLDAIAVAHDNTIEAVRDTNRKYYLGVQWHPERTEDPKLSLKLFEDLIRAAGG